MFLNTVCEWSGLLKLDETRPQVRNAREKANRVEGKTNINIRTKTQELTSVK
jgi:hypothetical protein